ncbi:DNA polymerase theta isoform X2 [Nasonia vitripennis]|uniref:DNA-directed DNA polymerase n=1 Tax=Nasonia vitripennis TaxID=7425 RepID=A0A7M7QD54_NASVI|nr:DNA polymerase theta isoform X2 [Nasonia vitripennis]
MSQTTRKKRLKGSQNASNLPRREDSDIANYFKDCLTILPDKAEPNENKVPKTKHATTTKSSRTRGNSRPVGSKSKLDTLDTLVPPKKWKVALAEKTANVNTSDGNNKSHDTTPNCLSIARSQKSFTSFKNRSNVFNNITDSFSSSKILSAQALSSIDSQKRLELASWGLPPLILEKYKARGIKTMFPWQVECLANKKILEENKNLVYSAPTSAGKTLVAEFLMLKTVLERKKKAIFILPFVSVVREKMFYFQDLLSDSGVRVEGFMGGVAPAGGFSAVHIAIATIEKANSLVNRLMEDGDLVTLGAVVIDELHLLGDPGRGYLLELLLTKLRYMTLSVEEVDIQLIGMSATLPNLPLIADWLDAELYKTDFRPIPLNEQCKFGSSLLDAKKNIIRELQPAPDIVNDTDNIIQLCIETINGGHGTLIFCPTKNWCEKLAIQLATTFFQLGRDNTPHGQILRKNIELESLQEVLLQLKSCPVGLDSVLRKTVSYGVAFHHAGLTMDERDIIEGGFRVGSLKVLIATSTLSSGVNLPARRVIIRSPMFNGKPLDKLTYQQMIGRAGRMGKDTEGESILVCKPNERQAATTLMTSSLDPIVSCLEGSGPLIRALLEAVASQVVRTPEHLDFYSKCTFVYKCEESEVKEMVDEAVKFLIANEFLLVKDSEEKEKRMVATCLGKACLSASIPPREGLFLFEELQRARKCFVLDTELHVIYLVTPFNSGSQINQIDWMIFLELWRALSESERRVGQLVGVDERFLMTSMRGIVKAGKPLNIHRRFFTAMALHDLVREVPLNTVCKKYNCCRGLLQSLQQSSATFAGMVTNFCKELKWDCMELLFAQFQARLQFGVCRDLLDLLRLPSLNGLRARSLFKHGITTAAELAVANEIEVEEALNKALPFESEKDFDGDNEAEVAKRTKMRTVFITGKDGMTAREAAVIVIKEARALVKNELGVQDVKWSQLNKSSNHSVPNSPTENLASLQPLSMTNNEPVTRNVSVEVHAVAVEPKDKVVDEPMEVILEVNEDIDTQKTIRNKNDESLPVFSQDVVNVSDRPEETSSRSLRSNLAEKVNAVTLTEKTPENTKDIATDNQRLSTSLTDVINVSDKPEQTNSRTLRSRLAERSRRSCLKDDHVTIRSIDFQDSPKNEEASNNKSTSPNSESFIISERALDEIMQVAKHVDKSEKFSSTNEKTLQATSKSLQIKNNGKDNHVTICSMDFQDSPKAQETNKPAPPPTQSFIVSQRAIDEIMQVAEETNKKSSGEFVIPAPVIDPKAQGEKKRDSGESNYSKSPSLFSDSSFMDGQICSILEKNVLDSVCMTEFEKSNFSQQNQGQQISNTVTHSSGTAPDKKAAAPKQLTPKTLFIASVTNENDKVVKETVSITPTTSTSSDPKQAIMNWTEDSWDQAKNPPISTEKPADNKIVETDDSPSLLHVTTTRARATRLKTLAASQLALSKIQTSSAKNQVIDSPLIGSPKFLTRKIIDKDESERSPIAGIRTYNTRRILLPSTTTSSNKSDSEDSIISSQTVNRNKTRTKIEKRVLATQKLGKSARVKEITPRVTCTAMPRLLKENSEPLFDDLSSGEDDVASTGSGLMFDSDDTVKSQTRNSKKIKEDSSSVYSLQFRRSGGCASSSEEKISLKTVEPVNVANSKRTFRLFRADIEGMKADERRKDLAVAFVTEHCTREPTCTIGNKIVGIEEKKKKEKKADAYVYGDRKLCGIVISWGTKAVYYMPFGITTETKITIKERMSFLRDILSDASVTLRCFNAKDVYKMFYICCEVEPNCSFLDPKAGDWLMNAETCNKGYTELAAQYFPRGIDIANACENNYGTYVLTRDARAGAKALLAWYVANAVVEAVKEFSPISLSAYKDIEMPTILILANMELRGFGINVESLQELATVIKNDLGRIEEEAFRAAGRKFNFYSSKEVSQVLGLNKRGRACTNKNALKSCENPISNLVTLWRKLTTVQTKIVFPLLQLERKNNRIHGNCITYTVTGRVSMHEPNLQTIPRDFKSDISGCILSVRMAFVPASGNIMLSADFCQLELRILAHFSQDPVLCKLLHGKGDIFKSIAARLNKTTEEQVDDDMRQRAKQLCYAMIYGMGAKSLAETLSATESEAKDYLEAFMGTYKGIRVWLTGVCEQARVEGFVSTIANRRRILPGINSKISAVKSQAERQAVNTKVQGSAADITKKAMVLIESKLKEEFSYLPITFPATQGKRKIQSSDADSRPRGGYLILQLHDELLYEVNSSDLRQVARIVKESMEHAFELRVPLPVKVRTGTAWGNLEEYQI